MMTNPDQGQKGGPSPSPSGGSGSTGNNLLKLLAVILLVPALMPFFLAPAADMYNHRVFYSLDQSIFTRRNSKRLRRQGGAEQADASGNRKIEPVVCGEYLRDKSIWDPNADMKKDDMKRLTITDPPFVISLHAMHL